MLHWWGGDARERIRFACFDCRVAFKSRRECPLCRGTMVAMKTEWHVPHKENKRQWEQSRRFVRFNPYKKYEPPEPVFQFIPKRVKTHEMGWATQYIEKLKNGESVSFRPRGNSMRGKVENGQLVTVTPADSYRSGDVVLCKVNGREYLHLITAARGSQFQIGNNVGGINGWITANSIYGKMVTENGR